MDEKFVDIDLSEVKYERVNENNNNKNYQITPIVHLTIFLTEWFVFMYWLIVCLNEKKILIIFMIINHLFLIFDYFHINIFIKNSKTKTEKVLLIIGIYKIIGVQIIYTYLVIIMYNDIHDIVFIILFSIHYVYNIVLLFACVFFIYNILK